MASNYNCNIGGGKMPESAANLLQSSPDHHHHDDHVVGINFNLWDTQIPPPIDLSGLDGPHHDQTVEALVKAAETIGVFQVINHGAKIESLEGLKYGAMQFFNQPLEVKKAYFQQLTNVSPTEMVNKLKELSNESRHNKMINKKVIDDDDLPKDQVRPSSFVKYGTRISPDNVNNECQEYLNLIYTNDAEALKYWPEQCKELALEYIKTSTNVARKILEVLMGKIGVEIDKEMVDSYLGLKFIFMNFYPVSPDPDQTVGIASHSDMGTITVLIQDDVGGLYGKAENEERWLEVPPVHGAMVIILGDTLEVLSNGKYKSCNHRVLASCVQPRVSIPIFLVPKLEIKIGPLPRAIGEDGKAAFREYLFGEYFKNLFGKPHAGKKYLEFAKITAP